MEGKKNDRKDDKTRWELIPLDCLEDIARVYTEGAKKYGDNTWQNLDNGYERYKGALLRHLYAAEHDGFDEETGCRHLAQVAWNAIALLWISKNKDKDSSSSREFPEEISDEIGEEQSIDDFNTNHIRIKGGGGKEITNSFEKTSILENTSLFAKYDKLTIRKDNKNKNLFYLVEQFIDSSCYIETISEQQAYLLKRMWKEFEKEKI
jgi:hypothetical protein|nr:MAG TPA_asm: hypothetical protein [Caudoviricetes sp.]